jgi:hypothetical protein
VHFDEAGFINRHVTTNCTHCNANGNVLNEQKADFAMIWIAAVILMRQTTGKGRFRTHSVDQIRNSNKEIGGMTVDTEILNYVNNNRNRNEQYNRMKKHAIDTLK